MKNVSKAVLCFAALLIFAAAAPQWHQLSGTWRIEHNNNSQRQLRIDFDDRDSNTIMDYRPAGIDGPSAPANFTLQREAGAFHFTGTLGAGEGSGSFTFTPDAAFAAGLTSRGQQFEGERDLMTAASIDLTLEYVDTIARAGYPHLSFDHLVAFRALRVTPGSIAALRNVFGEMSPEDVVSATAMHVDAAYVNELKTMNVGPVTLERAVTFKALHITKAYVGELARMGYGGLTPDQIVSFKAMHIDAAYLQHLASHGFSHLSAEQVIQMKAAGL